MRKGQCTMRAAFFLASVSLILAAASCASTLSASKLADPESSFIACRADLEITASMKRNELATISLSNPTRDNEARYQSVITKKRTVEPTYRIIAIKPGTYRLLPPMYSFKDLLGLEYRVKWPLKAEMSAVFRVNPGEVLYIGDYSIHHDEKTPTLDFEYDMDACRAALTAQYPALEGFVWIPSFADREAF